MFIPACPIEYYEKKLPELFVRFSNHECEIKGGKMQLMERYLKRARPVNIHIFVPGPKNAQLLSLLEQQVFAIINEVEYNLPHTISNIIVLPPEVFNYKAKKFNALIIHELMHIYQRSHPAGSIKLPRGVFAPMARPKMPFEITNPDTDHRRYGLHTDNKIIFCALEDKTGYAYNVHYYVQSARGQMSNPQIILRNATKKEIAFYNKQLPFSQNEHINEIQAIIIADFYEK